MEKNTNFPHTTKKFLDTFFEFRANFTLNCFGAQMLHIEFLWPYACRLSLRTTEPSKNHKQTLFKHFSNHLFQAIEIDPPDDVEYDVEAGFNSSTYTILTPSIWLIIIIFRCHLMHNFEEERPTSLVASIRESAKSSKRKMFVFFSKFKTYHKNVSRNYYCSFVCTPIKNLLLTFKLLIIIGLYSFIGAHIFMYLEVSKLLEDRCKWEFLIAGSDRFRSERRWISSEEDSQGGDGFEVSFFFSFVD